MSKSRNDQHPAVLNRTMEIAVSAALLLIGLVVAWDSWRLGARWGSDGPESGYFPFYVGLIIAVSAVVILLQALRGRTPNGRGAFVERGQLRLVMSVLVPAIVYVVAIQWFGIYLASAVYIAGFMIWLGNYPWWSSALLGVATSAAVFMMFEIWFQVPLYKGSLYNPLAVFGF
jgi:putative tricarboxylic transport membrane protein